MARWLPSLISHMLRIGCVTCAKTSQEHEECHVFLQPNGEAMEVQQSHCHAISHLNHWNDFMAS